MAKVPTAPAKTLISGCSSSAYSVFVAVGARLVRTGLGCGLKGVTVKTQAELTAALKEACEAQKNRVTTFIEVLLNQELGEPFRRDAMKKPVKVAGIDKADMKPQVVG